MSMTRRAFKEVEALQKEHHDLGLLDDKNRRIGAFVRVALVEVVEDRFMCDLRARTLDVGSRHVVVRVVATRDGQAYGATPSAKYIGLHGAKKTEELLSKEILRRLNSMQRRYGEKFGR